MKKLLVLFLAMIMCASVFFGCAKDSGGEIGVNGENSGEKGNEGSADSGSSQDQSGEGGETDGGGNSEFPRDILEGLPYTLVCKDKETLEVIDFQFNDQGKLNDGLYRSTSDLKEEENRDMCVKIDGSSRYLYEITFTSDGRYDGYRFVVHNTDLKFSFSKIEVGTDLDDLHEIDFESDYEITENMHSDDFADFELTTVNTVRVTFTSGSHSSTSFDELSLLGVPKGEKVPETLPETIPDPTPEDTPDTPQGKLDAALYGTWSSYDPEILEEDDDYSLATFTFVSDGTGLYDQEGLSLPFTWHIENDVICMDVAIAGLLEKPYYFENGFLYMPDEDGRITQFKKASN